MGKEANILFNVPVGMPFWVRGEHEPMLVDLFLPIITHSYWRGPCTVIGSELATGRVISL